MRDFWRKHKNEIANRIRRHYLCFAAESVESMRQRIKKVSCFEESFRIRVLFTTTHVVLCLWRVQKISRNWWEKRFVGKIMSDRISRFSENAWNIADPHSATITHTPAAGLCRFRNNSTTILMQFEISFDLKKGFYHVFCGYLGPPPIRNSISPPLIRPYSSTWVDQ